MKCTIYNTTCSENEHARHWASKAPISCSIYIKVNETSCDKFSDTMRHFPLFKKHVTNITKYFYLYYSFTYAQPTFVHSLIMLFTLKEGNVYVYIVSYLPILCLMSKFVFYLHFLLCLLKIKLYPTETC